MKRTFCIFVVLVGVLSCSGVVRAGGDESFSFGPFGRFFCIEGIRQQELYSSSPETTDGARMSQAWRVRSDVAPISAVNTNQLPG